MLMVLLNPDLVSDRLDAGLVMVLVDLAVYGNSLLLYFDGLDEFLGDCGAELFPCFGGVLSITAADHVPVSFEFQTLGRCGN